MNLMRIRVFIWFMFIIKYYKEYKLKMIYGDQDFMNIYFYFYFGKNIRMILYL